MIKRYKYQETIIKDSQDRLKWLSTDCNDKSVLRIFRLLSGTCRVLDEFDEKKYKIDINYFNLPYSKNNRFKQSCISDLFPDEIDLTQLSDFFKSLNRNKDFYDAIEVEVINCIIARKKGHYLESFLFLYRIMEGMSYSIPLIYTSKSKSFTKSFKALQKYMQKNTQDGELVFFKRFVQEVFNEESFFNSTIDIRLDDIDIEELKPIYYKIYKSKIDSTKIQTDIEDEAISVNFIDFFDFLIEIRNRYFHFLQGTWKDNISTTQIIHPDIFFKPIVDLGINWVAIIFFEVIKFDIDNQAR